MMTKDINYMIHRVSPAYKIDCNCPVRFGRLSPGEVILFKSKGKGRAHFQCGHRCLSPAECLQKPLTGQVRRFSGRNISGNTKVR